MRYEVWVREYTRKRKPGEVAGTFIWETIPVERFWRDCGRDQAGAERHIERLNGKAAATQFRYYLKEYATEGTQMQTIGSIESGGEQR